MGLFWERQAMSDPKVQGEGDYESARRYNEKTKEFVEEGKVGPAADKARTDDPAKAAELEQAERQARERSKGEDPLLHPENKPGQQGGERR
jgi:hypothetical protein